MDDAFFRRILDHVADGVYFVDRDRRILYWNKAAEALTGYTAREAVALDSREDILCRLDAGGGVRDGDCLPDEVAAGGQPRADAYIRHKQGHRIPVRAKSEAILDENGDVVGSVEVFSDVSEHLACLEQVEELTRETLRDPLTGVGNRRYADISLNARFDEARRYGWPFGVLFMDIDNFKAVNDTHGHDVGDDVLRAVANTLAANVRSFDFVGRWGGEEFVVVMPNVDEHNTLMRLAERFRRLVALSAVDLPGKGPLSVTVSVGATMARPGETPDGLMRRVDELMYASKEGGRDCVTTDVADTCLARRPRP